MTSHRAVQYVGFLCISCVSVGNLFAQAPPQIQKKSLETHIQQVTGAPRVSVVDCGEYGVADFGGTTPNTLSNLQNSLTCAREAASQYKPFRIVVHGMTEDSRTAYGVLANVAGPEKGMFWFQYDSAPCGGDTCAEKFEMSPWRIQDIVVFVNEQGQYEFGRLKR